MKSLLRVILIGAFALAAGASLACEGDNCKRSGGSEKLVGEAHSGSAVDPRP